MHAMGKMEWASKRIYKTPITGCGLWVSQWGKGLRKPRFVLEGKMTMISVNLTYWEGRLNKEKATTGKEVAAAHVGTLSVGAQ